jgi:hypothetical protein
MPPYNNGATSSKMCKDALTLTIKSAKEEISFDSLMTGAHLLESLRESQLQLQYRNDRRITTTSFFNDGVML